MAKEGIFTRIVSAERALASRAMLFNGYYSGKHTKKTSRKHVVVRDELNAKNIMNSAKRCTASVERDGKVEQCGGWTFSSLLGSGKCVCRHCGKQYFKDEFHDLPDGKLVASEIHDRHIYSVLLAGGDLREHAEESNLVFKDENGVLLGHLPMEYAEHLAATYKGAYVLKNIKAAEPIRHAVGVSPVGAV